MIPPAPISQTAGAGTQPAAGNGGEEDAQSGHEDQESEDDQGKRVGEDMVQVCVQQGEREDVQDAVGAARPEAEHAVQGVQRHHVHQLDGEQQHDEGSDYEQPALGPRRRGFPRRRSVSRSVQHAGS